MLTLDHLVIAAENLADGVAYVRDKLGVEIPFGGKHPLMATHNHVMQLGPEAFLEVIAIDPDAEVSRNRWFGLDEFAGHPRLIHWVARVDNMIDAKRLSVDVGPALDVTRGDLFWQLTVRAAGDLPFEGAFPSIIDWPKGQFPVPRMADLGCTLEQFSISSPKAEAVRDALAPHFSDTRVVVLDGAFDLKAEIRTPAGLVRI